MALGKNHVKFCAVGRLASKVALRDRGVTLVAECSGVSAAVPRRYTAAFQEWQCRDLPFDPFVVVNMAITIQWSAYCVLKDYHNAMRSVGKNHRRFPLLTYITHWIRLEDSRKVLRQFSIAWL